jgi:hypothetical protein
MRNIKLFTEKPDKVSILRNVKCSNDESFPRKTTKSKLRFVCGMDNYRLLIIKIIFARVLRQNPNTKLIKICPVVSGIKQADICMVIFTHLFYVIVHRTHTNVKLFPYLPHVQFKHSLSYFIKRDGVFTAELFCPLPRTPI